MKVNFQFFQMENDKRGKYFKNAFDRVLKSGWYILGNEVKLFESNFSKFLNVKYCIGVSNGLEAIQISLMALNIKVGDEVITTPVSAVATTLAILAVGAKPVFVDIDENGLINVDMVEEKITKNTKAILPVHLYGNPVNLNKLTKIASKYNIPIIEDAAQAHGAFLDNKRIGSFGTLACFSFYPTKNLGAIGDAGAVVTNDKKLAEKVALIRDYGQLKKYVHTEYGMNSRLDELQAAILNEKLKFLNADNKIRETIATTYESLSDINELSIIEIPENAKSSRHQFIIKVKNREKLVNFLKNRNIDTLIHYPITIPDQPLFKSYYENEKIPVAREFVKETLSLPIHPFMRKSEAIYVVSTIKEFFNDQK